MTMKQRHGTGGNTNLYFYTVVPLSHDECIWNVSGKCVSGWLSIRTWNRQAWSRHAKHAIHDGSAAASVRQTVLIRLAGFMSSHCYVLHKVNGAAMPLLPW